jgi:hypothetical protein
LTKTKWYPKNSLKIALPKDFINQNIEILIIIDDINAYINSFDET